MAILHQIDLTPHTQFPVTRVNMQIAKQKNLYYLLCVMRYL